MACGRWQVECGSKRLELCTTHVQFLEILLSKKHPPPLTLPLEGGGEGGGDSFLVAVMPLCVLCISNEDEWAVNLLYFLLFVLVSGFLLR